MLPRSRRLPEEHVPMHPLNRSEIFNRPDNRTQDEMRLMKRSTFINKTTSNNSRVIGRNL